MALIRANTSGGGGNINPTVVFSEVFMYSSGSFHNYTIDLSKDYLVIGSYKYNDSSFRQEIQLVQNGTVVSLTNNTGWTVIALSTISGNILSYGFTTGGGAVYVDFSIVQLN